MSDGLFDETSAAGLAQEALGQALAALRTIQAQAKAIAEARAAVTGSQAAIAALLAAVGIDHRWTGTVLQLRLPDGNYAEGMDLVGPEGPEGPAPTFVIGTAVSGASAGALLSPDPAIPNRYILDFVLPRGERGEKGDTPDATDLDLSDLRLPWAQVDDKPPLFSGAYGELTGRPTLGTAAARDAGAANGVGTLGADGKAPVAQVPLLDAAQIGSGVFDPARIPVVASGVQVVSAGDLTALTAGQRSAITKGAVVTTQDGYRYLYGGAGDKTDAASYILLADVTPDWSVIANKPTTFVPAAHTHTAAEISDASAAGRTVLTAADKAAIVAYLALAIGDIAGLTSALAGKAAASYATASDIWAGTDTGKIVTAAVLKAAQVPQALAISGGAVAWNMANGFNATLALTATASLSAPTNPLANVDYYLDVTQPASGGPFTLSYAAAFNFGTDGAPSLTTTAGKRDKLAFRCTDATPGAVKFDFIGIKKGY